MLISRLCYLLQIYTISISVLWTCGSAQAETDRSPDQTVAAPILFIGHKPTHHYVIVIPQEDPSNDKIRSQLVRIRNQIAPTGQTSFITQNHLGHYIYAASFTDRHQAEIVRQQLLNDEFRARVVYFP